MSKDCSPLSSPVETIVGTDQPGFSMRTSCGEFWLLFADEQSEAIGRADLAACRMKRKQEAAARDRKRDRARIAESKIEITVRAKESVIKRYWKIACEVEGHEKPRKELMTS
ncbi:hypothetical protein K0M31_019828 [Melipona bicolor]|uniref:Uncharacterized protein n=1 Tax=Melipona bicolor TaxID=60889 RepID=A0AA40G3T6_9HYME|nr:hypothetical protein K0M31_019828 [Melipona bicolor]